MKERIKNLNSDLKKLIIGVCLFILVLPLGFVVIKNAQRQAGKLKSGGLGDIVNSAPQNDAGLVFQEEIAAMLEQIASSTQATSTATTSDF